MDEKILNLMAQYDASPIGSAERVEFGSKIEKEGSKLSERDFWRVAYSYRDLLLKKGN